MKQQHFGLSLVLAITGGTGIVGCSCEEQRPATDGDASVSTDTSGSDSLSTSNGTAAGTGASTTTASTTLTTNSGSGNSTGTGTTDTAGTGLSGTGSDTASTGPTCEIPGLTVFPHSETAEAWDDNDFSTVTLEGTCPVLVNVTWPHEADWQGADPSEANQEQTYFTLDSPASGDLTGKQLNLTIELAADAWGPEATTGGYIVSLVSVSSYQYETIDYPEESSASGSSIGDAGVVNVDASSLDASVVDASVDAAFVNGGADGGTSNAAPMTLINTGYSEAESALEDRVILRHVGDRASISFALPNKTEVDSYDPASAIKINVRIYNMFTETPAPEEPVDAGALIDAGDAGDGGSAAQTTGTLGTSSTNASSSAATGSSSVATSSTLETASTLTSGTSTDSTSTAVTPNARVYSYLTSQFAITNFSVTDVGR